MKSRDVRWIFPYIRKYIRRPKGSLSPTVDTKLNRSKNQTKIHTKRIEKVLWRKYYLYREKISKMSRCVFYKFNVRRANFLKWFLLTMIEYFRKNFSLRKNKRSHCWVEMFFCPVASSIFLRQYSIWVKRNHFKKLARRILNL